MMQNFIMDCYSKVDHNLQVEGARLYLLFCIYAFVLFCRCVTSCKYDLLRFLIMAFKV